MNMPCSVIEIINQFLSEQSICANSRKTYKYSIINFFSFITGSEKWNPKRNDEVRNVTTAMIVDFKEYQNIMNRSEYSTSLYLSVIKRFFKWTSIKGIHEDVANSIRSPRCQHRNCKDSLSAEQARMLFLSVDRTTETGKRTYAILSLLIYNGLRCIEVTRMNNKDVIIEGDLGFISVQGKGHINKDTIVALNQTTINALNDYQQSKRYYEPDDPLFLAIGKANLNHRLTTRMIIYIVSDRLKATGIKTDRISTHSLRHTGANLLYKEQSTPDLMRFMRHTSLAVTERYIRQIEQSKRPSNKLTNRLSELIEVD